MRVYREEAVFKPVCIVLETEGEIRVASALARTNIHIPNIFEGGHNGASKKEVYEFLELLLKALNYEEEISGITY